MEALICILTLGFDCGIVDDNRHHFEPVHQERPAAAVPEPTAALLFGVGLVTAAIATRRKP